MLEELRLVPSLVNTASSQLPSLHGLSRADLGGFFAQRGLSPVHAARVWSLLHWECAQDWAQLEALPAKVLDTLRGHFSLGVLRVEREQFSSDGHTRKMLLGLGDGRAVEAVLMRFTGRATACLSSQVGCAMGCVFCATGQMGFLRNLGADEIVGQALHVQRLLRAHGAQAVRPEGAQETAVAPGAAETRLRNLVLMGMGEPLHNYEAVMKAVDIVCDPGGLAIAGARITLSTVGVVPGIVQLADEGRRVHLAVSLHAATQAEREALVPVARRWPLDTLMEACRYYSSRLGRRVFFEWTLIAGVNDGPGQARAVGRLLSGLPAQVNLIPLNPTLGYEGGPAGGAGAREFQRILDEEFSLPCTVRQRRGIDIGAGCGQLAAPEQR